MEGMESMENMDSGLTRALNRHGRQVGFNRLFALIFALCGHRSGRDKGLKAGVFWGLLAGI